MRIRQHVLTVATLALVAVGWSGVRADEAEEKAVKTIEKFGGRVIRDKKAEDKPVIH
jgi:hypothetical protein